MLRRIVAGLMLACSCGTAAWAQDEASDGKWFIRAGVTGLSLADGLKLKLAGTPVPGAALNTKNHATPTLQIGREIGPHLAVELTIGIPPNIDITGRGTLQPLGKLADTTYGPCLLVLQYRPLRHGTIQPYLGAGVGYMIVFDADDGAFKDIEIDNDVGPALEAGTDIMLSERAGIFLDVKKAFLRTDARGTFGGAPVMARAKLDPWAVSVGATFRF